MITPPPAMRSPYETDDANAAAMIAAVIDLRRAALPGTPRSDGQAPIG